MIEQQRAESAGGSNADDRLQPGAWRTVAIFTLVYAIGMLDRNIVSLLVPHIKRDLALTDLQLSLIQGLAFGLCFMIASPVAGWLVDRVNRPKVLLVGLSVWSIGGIASGLSRTFGQLFGARATVGAFEATINPTSYSLLSDLFPPRKLALPLSVFVLGGNIGAALSFVVGGAVVAWAASSEMTLPVVGNLHGWQLAFIVAGIPGLIFAPLLLLATEPRRRSRRTAATVDDKPRHTGFGDLWAYARHHKRFYAGHLLGFGLVMSFIVGLQAWNATFLSRHFGWELARIGSVLGWTQLASALVGLALHGFIVDKLYSRGIANAHLLYFVAMAGFATPCGVAAYLAGSATMMVVFYNLAYFLLMGFAGIGPAALQIATPANLRGKASAAYMVAMSIIGTVLAPIIVATFTDVLFGDESKLGYSMALFAGLTGMLAVIAFLWAAGAMRAAVENARNYGQDSHMPNAGDT